MTSDSNRTYVAPHSNRSYVAPHSTIILTAIVLVLFLIVFCSVYICRCIGYWNLQRIRGIHDSNMKKFPIFTYAAVKNLQGNNFSLECAICLSEFSDDDFLRLLTPCRHVFHQRCIDIWLASNNTCPVCRTSLDGPEKSQSNLTLHTGRVITGVDRNEDIGDSIIINIPDRENEGLENRAHSEGWEEPQPPMTIDIAGENVFMKNWVKNLSKSHSTGHSYSKVRNISEVERCRLPEHLHTQLISQYSHMRKCSTYREIDRPRWAARACFGSGHAPRIKMSL